MMIYNHGKPLCTIIMAVAAIMVSGYSSSEAATLPLLDATAGQHFAFNFGSVTEDPGVFSGIPPAGAIRLTETFPTQFFGGWGGNDPGSLQFDASTALIEVVYRPLASNAAADFLVTLADRDINDDDPGTTDTDDYGYFFSTSAGTPVGGGFLSQQIAVSAFDQGPGAAFQQDPGDGIQNFDAVGGLVGFSVQLRNPGFNPGGDPGQETGLDIELQSISIITVDAPVVPEPSTMALGCLSGLVMLAGRSRS